MAEKYGEIPPRFTGAWWEYFWTYYKWHVLIPLFAVIFAVVTITQCATRKKYDLNITYAGHMVYSDAEMQKLHDVLLPEVEDIDENGEPALFVQQLNFSDMAGSEEFDYAVQTKLDIELGNEGSYLFFYDKSELDIMSDREASDEIYVPVSEWGENIPSEKIYEKNGCQYGVNLKDSKLLRDNGIYCDDLYAVIRRNYSDDEKSVRAAENAARIANILAQ